MALLLLRGAAATLLCKRILDVVRSHSFIRYSILHHGVVRCLGRTEGRKETVKETVRSSEGSRC